MQTTPGTFEDLKSGVMEDGVDLPAKHQIDCGEAVVES
ncbi:hypothetical protein PSAC2689_200037 [Paraburkholderia sacchari]